MIVPAGMTSTSTLVWTALVVADEDVETPRPESASVRLSTFVIPVLGEGVRGVTPLVALKVVDAAGVEGRHASTS